MNWTDEQREFVFSLCERIHGLVEIVGKRAERKSMAVDPKTLRPGDKIKCKWGTIWTVSSNDGHKIAYTTKGCGDLVDGNSPGYWESHTLVSRASPDPIPGVGPNTETAVNEAGGRQSAIPYRCDLLPPKACLAVAHIMHGGAAKYGDTNWHAIPERDHINHAMTHLFAHATGDTQDDHLGHAATRLLMALEVRLKGDGQ